MFPLLHFVDVGTHNGSSRILLGLLEKNRNFSLSINQVVCNTMKRDIESNFKSSGKSIHNDMKHNLHRFWQFIDRQKGSKKFPNSIVF